MVISTIIRGVADDVLGALVPGLSGTLGAIADATWDKVRRERIQRGNERLLEELRKGEVRLGDHSMPEAVAIVERFQRAALEGTALLNLRLMAKVIAGQAHLGVLRADEFLYQANLLGSLRREEVILVAMLLRKKREHDSKPRDAGESRSGADWNAAAAELVPGTFRTTEEMRATGLAATRTGLVMDDNSIDGIGRFTASPLLEQLASLIDIEDALAREPSGSKTHDSRQ